MLISKRGVLVKMKVLAFVNLKAAGGPSGRRVSKDYLVTDRTFQLSNPNSPFSLTGLQHLITKPPTSIDKSFAETFAAVAQVIGDEATRAWNGASLEITKASGIAKENLYKAYLLALDHADQISNTQVQPTLKRLKYELLPKQQFQQALVKAHENLLLKLVNPVEAIKGHVPALLKVNSHSLQSLFAKGAGRLNGMLSKFPTIPSQVRQRSLVTA